MTLTRPSLANILGLVKVGPRLGVRRQSSRLSHSLNVGADPKCCNVTGESLVFQSRGVLTGLRAPVETVGPDQVEVKDPERVAAGDQVPDLVPALDQLQQSGRRTCLGTKRRSSATCLSLAQTMARRVALRNEGQGYLE